VRPTSRRPAVTVPVQLWRRGLYFCVFYSSVQNMACLSVWLCVVIISTLDSESGLSETRCILSSNDWFGEVGVVNAAPRNASVISRRCVELLVFSDMVRTLAQARPRFVVVQPLTPDVFNAVGIQAERYKQMQVTINAYQRTTKLRIRKDIGKKFTSYTTRY